MRYLVLFAIVCSLFVSSFEAADAAVRQCHSVIVGPEKSHKDRTEAKRLALAVWKKQARGFGRGYDSWRLAYAKALKCHKTDAGFRCVAAGAPCIIRQVPGRRAPSEKPESDGVEKRI